MYLICTWRLSCGDVIVFKYSCLTALCCGRDDVSRAWSWFFGGTVTRMVSFFHQLSFFVSFFISLYFFVSNRITAGFVEHSFIVSRDFARVMSLAIIKHSWMEAVHLHQWIYPCPLVSYHIICDIVFSYVYIGFVPSKICKQMLFPWKPLFLPAGILYYPLFFVWNVL